MDEFNCSAVVANPQGWAANSRVDVARDLFACLTAFYKTFPDQAKVDLYITGESYAGE